MGRQANIVDFEQAKASSKSARAPKHSGSISASAPKPTPPLSKEKTSAPRPHVAKAAAVNASSRRRTATQAHKNAKPQVRVDSTKISETVPAKAASEKSRKQPERARLSEAQKARAKHVSVKAVQSKVEPKAGSRGQVKAAKPKAAPAKSAKPKSQAKAVKSKTAPARPVRTAKVAKPASASSSAAKAKRAPEPSNAKAARAESTAKSDERKREPGIREKVEKQRHDMRKKRADRTFDRKVKSEPAPSGNNEGAPRAALYATKMGSSHRRSARMQNEQAGNAPAIGFSLSSAAGFLTGRSQRFYAACTIVLCVLISGAFLYPTAQNYYTAVREQQKVEAEYAAIEARNATLQDDISYLSTQAGIEDRVREQYGWVKTGENAVRVTGLSSSSDTGNNAATLVTVGAVTAPDTWYSGFLDAVFGYRK